MAMDEDEYTADALVNRMDDDDDDKNAPMPELGAFDMMKMPRGSYLLVNCVGFMDGCDEQLLPSSFRGMEQQVGFNPWMLGGLAMAQSFWLAISCPVWGTFADRHTKRKILGFGCCFWGLTTMILAQAYNYAWTVTLRSLNGIAMGSTEAITLTLLAHGTAGHARGSAFGLLQFFSSFGRVLGNLVTTAVGTQTIFGITGWRLTLAVLGFALVCLGMAILEVLPEEHPMTNENHLVDYLSFLRDVRVASLARPTTGLLLAESIFVTVPYAATAFSVMFYQYCGMQDLIAGTTSALGLVGTMVGGLLFGYLGDRLARANATQGRLFLAITLITFKMALIAVLYIAIPRSPKYTWAFMLVSFFVGMTHTTTPSTHRPILSEVVKPKHRASVYGMVVALEAACGAILGTCIVGVLADYAFGYTRTRLSVMELNRETADINARALALAIVCVAEVACLFSGVMYIAMLFSYRKDRETFTGQDPNESMESLLTHNKEE